MKRVLIYLVCSLIALAPGTAAHAQDAVGDLLGRINALRTSVGVAPYSLNGALAAAAQSQAQWIADTGSVSHTRPDGSGPRTRALNAGYPSSDVSENIYGGSNAGVGDAWGFWANSDIHYRGLVNDRYHEIGIGIGRSGWGTAYVLVFGNPGGLPPPRAGGGGSGGQAEAAGPPQQPSYVRGLDAVGNIMHEVQPGDTLGDILLIYGYTWDVLPYLQQINNIADVRDLEIGAIILVPPQAGTYTPTPGDPIPGATATSEYPTPYPEDPVEALAALPQTSPTAPGIATAQALPTQLNLVAFAPTPTETPLALAQVPTVSAETLADAGVQTSSTQPLPTWLLVGLGLQIVILVGAGIEFYQRARRK
jgi:hypothetical protein